MKIIIRSLLVLCCLAFSLCPWPAKAQEKAKTDTAAPAAKTAPRAGSLRPSIFLNLSHLAELEARTRSGSPYWARLKAWTAKAARRDLLIADGPGLALAWLVQRDSSPGNARPLGRLAVGCALRAIAKRPENDLISASRLVGQVALTLDWAWGAFRPEERQKIARWLVEAGRSFAGRGLGCFDTASAAGFKLAALAGAAARGLVPGADELIRQAAEERFKKRLLPCLTGGGSGGAWFEGSHGGARAGLFLLEGAAALQSAAGLDMISQTPWFGDRLGYLIFNQLPGAALGPNGAYRRPAPDGDATLPAALAADMIRLQMAMLCRLLPEQDMAGWALNLLLDRRAPAVTHERFFAAEFLWLNAEASFQPMATAPLTYWAAGLGRGFSRSDWSSRATWLKLSAGPHYAFGQHLNATGLQLYRRGFLLPPAGGYDGPVTSYAQNYGIRTLAHNTVIIKDPGEYSWLDMRSGYKPKGTYANDGGQRSWTLFGQEGRAALKAPWNPDGWDWGKAPWTKLEPVYRVGALEQVDERPRFAYLRAEATKAYRGSTLKADRVVRHVFHLRAGGPQDAEAVEVVAVVDDVSLAREQARVGYCLHFPAAPRVSGQMEILGPGRQSVNASRLRVVLESSRLDVLHLWPPRPRLELYGGQDLAAGWVGGKNYRPDPPAKMLAPHRVEFFPQVQGGANRAMVHALLPADQDDPEPPVVKPLAASGPGLAGLVVMDQRWPRVVAVRLGPPDPGAEISYARPAPSSRHLVAGLVPDKRYAVKVTQKNVTISPSPAGAFTSSPGGVLWFLVAPETQARPMAGGGASPRKPDRSASTVPSS